MSRNSLLAALCACAISICPASPANAAFILTIDDPLTAGIDVSVSDVDGNITYNSAVGAFSVVVTTALSKPVLTGSSLLFLNSVQVTGGAGTLIIGLTDTDYTGVPAALTGSFGGTTDGTVDINFLYDGSNTEFGGASFFDPAAATAAFSGTGTGLPATPGSPYSLSIIANVVHSGSGASSFSANITAVPVPAAMWLFGSGLLGLAGAARRRRMA